MSPVLTISTQIGVNLPANGCKVKHVGQVVVLEKKIIIFLLSLLLLVAFSKNSFSDQLVKLSIPLQSQAKNKDNSENNAAAALSSTSAIKKAPDLPMIPSLSIDHHRAMAASCDVKNYNVWGKCKLWLKPHQYMRVRSYNFGVPYNVANIELQLASQGTDAVVFTRVVNSAELDAGQVVMLSALGRGGGVGRIFTSVSPIDMSQPVTIYLQNNGPSLVFIRVL
ncbi:hypothetical protein Psal026_01093 [Piscirickettsia salmonis]|nr:hypothetical protein Psal026_01093 [Piscirickettsia salmonis]